MNMNDADYEKMGINKVGMIVKLRTAVDQLKSVFAQVPVNIF